MLQLNQQDLNLGTLKFGEPYSFNFMVTNTGTEPVNVIKLSEGCTTCTKIFTKNFTLNPSQSKQVDVTFTPGSLGHQVKRITVYYNTDKTKTQSVVFKFTANVHVHS